MFKLDSDMALSVIETLQDQGVLVLSIHDSFIVKVSHRKELEEAMAHAYQKVLNINDREHKPMIKHIINEHIYA